MVIDEDRNYILTNYKPCKSGEKAIDSDHLTLFMDLNIEISNKRPTREYFYNFHDQISLNKFKQLTSQTGEFTDCFNNDLPVRSQIEQ